MKGRPALLTRTCLLLLLTLFGLWSAAAPCAAGGMEELLPAASCASGWNRDGKSQLYDRETLSDRIDGEAELYFPYGFRELAAARYRLGKDPQAGMDVEIYRMGSPLDAFGMFANYRQKDAEKPALGAEASLATPELFFYQGSHFVHIQITGSERPDPGALLDCGRAVAGRLPADAKRPSELSLLNRVETVPGSERYLPESLLGYSFLNRGVIADATLQGAPLQIFYLLGNTEQTAALALEAYRSQLSAARLEPADRGGAFLEGGDPLYGPVTVLRRGTCLAGALKYSPGKGVRPLLELICR